MALYNKDGTVYKLDGPNPTMKNQEFWTEFTVHNMHWKKEVHQDKGIKSSNIKEIKTQSEEFMEDLQNSKIEDPIITKNSEPQQTSFDHLEYNSEKDKASLSEKKEKINKESIQKTFIHCLPSIIKEKKDSLYGDISSRIEYKEKTSFEAVILNQTDMTIEMWSEVVFQKGSILYPKNGDKRWWRIQNYYPKLGGYVIQCVPSQDQPYFD